jgi:hypothetical protein
MADVGRDELRNVVRVYGVNFLVTKDPSSFSILTLLDLGETSPQAIFTAVIYGDNRSKFGTPETSLRASASA